MLQYDLIWGKRTLNICMHRERNMLFKSVFFRWRKFQITSFHLFRFIYFYISTYFIKNKKRTKEEKAPGKLGWETKVKPRGGQHKMHALKSWTFA